MRFEYMDGNHNRLKPRDIVAAVVAVGVIAVGANRCIPDQPDESVQPMPTMACNDGYDMRDDQIIIPKIEEADSHEAHQDEAEQVRTFSVIHNVKPGETLSGIAGCYFEQPELGLQSILKSNPTITDPNLISVDKPITINLTTAKSFEIEQDTTIEVLAESTGLAPETLASANGKKSKLNTGERLIVPVQDTILTDETTNVYVVESGDTLSAIARNAGITLVDLLEINNGHVPDAQNLKPGHLLVVPINVAPVAPGIIETPFQSVEEKLQAYLDVHGDIARKTAEKYGLPFEAIVAQSMKETAYGTSELALNANNMFGMKAKPDWEGKIYNKITSEEVTPDNVSKYPGAKVVRTLDNGNVMIEVKQPFRAYDSVEDAFNDYGKWITESGYYNDAAKKVVPEEYARALVNTPTYIGEGRWATDSRYAEGVISIIENLRKLAETPVAPEIPIPRTVEERIKSVELTAEGYERFKESINRDFIEYAKTKKSFSPDNGLDQTQPTEMMNLHFTTLYVNEENDTSKPIGNVNVKRLIDSMNNRDGPDGSCCGIQWFIDRNGQTFQFVEDINTKLSHNPPFSQLSTGVELESDTQENITPKQYESAMYLSIYVLEKQELLGKSPLESILQGHGEIRSKLRAAGHDYDVRSDFPENESELFRAQMIPLLKKYGYYNN
jgi:LysM repeat protein